MMNKSMFKYGILCCLVMLGIASCDNSPAAKAEKVDAAKADVVDANKELDKAVTDSLIDYTVFKSAADRKIAENDEKIVALKAEIKSEKESVRTMHEKDLDRLNSKNASLKTEIDNYKKGDINQWTAFKQRFNTDLDELGQSISASAKKNLK